MKPRCTPDLDWTHNGMRRLLGLFISKIVLRLFTKGLHISVHHMSFVFAHAQIHIQARIRSYVCAKYRFDG
jgi:hypothetical protein